MPVCLVCAGTAFRVVAAAERLQEECRIRERFVERRLTRSVEQDELKDLTDFFHAEKADLLACETCGLLVREEHDLPPAQDYSEDEYDASVMEHQYPQYLEAFRKKAQPYRDLLPTGAQILEVGSHYGAFLQVAKEWGWKAEGVDPGKDTSRFARSNGLQVHVAALEECQFPAEQFDAIFVWNCFEQIDDPSSMLAVCRRILKPNGLLTVRTPDGLFYATCQRLLREADLEPSAKEFLVGVMGYNNLLGFPYRYGHSSATLQRLIEPHGFRLKGSLQSELLTFPLPENPCWVEQEKKTVSERLRLLAKSVAGDLTEALTAPWIEAWFQTTERP
jgi:2-polyprenyl-3-methyl-5-hydroxy-6-metoxy-1,4-benzoquinol methylase